MTSSFFDRLRRRPSTRRVRTGLAVGAGCAAFGLMAALAVAPPAQPTEQQKLSAYVDIHAQSLTVAESVALKRVIRDQYAATPGLQALANSGTNYDWAKMILMYGGWPMSDGNVTVLTRWMRQENGANNWWNRNNPLNNGWGSSGGGGTGSYPNLVIAAQMVVAMLNGNPDMRPIVVDLAADAPTTATEQAIWASPWASSHYGNGSHWHYTPVDVVKAPVGAW